MTSALLVVDAQRIYTDPESEMKCPDSDSTVKRINQLIEFFQTEKQPIVLIRHVHKADGTDLGRLFDFAGDEVEEFNFKEGTDDVKYDERLSRPKGSLEVIKNRYSAFAGTDLDKKLRKLKVTRLVICGFMTNFCCESTARNAHDLDYYVDFVLDATGTPGTEGMDEGKVRKVVGELLEEGFACVMSVKDYLASR